MGLTVSLLLDQRSSEAPQLTASVAGSAPSEIRGNEVVFGVSDVNVPAIPADVSRGACHEGSARLGRGWIDDHATKQHIVRRNRLLGPFDVALLDFGYSDIVRNPAIAVYRSDESRVELLTPDGMRQAWLVVLDQHTIDLCGSSPMKTAASDALLGLVPLRPFVGHHRHDRAHSEIQCIAAGLLVDLVAGIRNLQIRIIVILNFKMTDKLDSIRLAFS